MTKISQFAAVVICVEMLKTLNTSKDKLNRYLNRYNFGSRCNSICRAINTSQTFLEAAIKVKGDAWFRQDTAEDVAAIMEKAAGNLEVAAINSGLTLENMLYFEEPQPIAIAIPIEEDSQDDSDDDDDLEEDFEEEDEEEVEVDANATDYPI